MSKQQRISAYTPSNMDPQLLKRIFVQRERLLDRIVDRLTVSMTTGTKHHILLVGPRGSGKTHLVTLAVWELKQQPKLRETMRIAWLGEDDIFSSLIHFAFAIARSLADEYPDEFPADFKSTVRGLPQDDAALAVLRNVITNLANRHLLLITENLDQTFNGLGEMGQKKLRAFLQETRRIATLATTQQLFAGVSSRNEAFFGFFDTQHLEPLTVDDAQELIRKIAVEQQKTDLIQFLNSNDARYRIRALHHLAGGNYRMYVLLAEFLTRDTLDDLVIAFETLAEEMTPYFQERMRSLPDQQRQLAQYLCDAEGALTVKDISEETFIADSSCSKQLGHLKAKGYVRSEKRGKESYYDMAEPLMRLCLEVKNQRGRPLKLVARFLKAWFPAEKLHSSLTTVDNYSRSAEYCKVALQCDSSFEAVINSKLKAEIDQQMKVGEFSKALALSDELSVSDQSTGLLYRASASSKLLDWKSAQIALTQRMNIANLSSIQKVLTLVTRGETYGQLGDKQAELADYTAVIAMPDAPVEQKAVALMKRGVTYGKLGDIQAELADFTSVVQMLDLPNEQKARALIERGVTYGKLGDIQAELADFTSVIEMLDVPNEQKARALIERGMAYGLLGDTNLECADYSSAIEMPNAPNDLKAIALLNRGATCGAVGDMLAAIADYTAVVDISSPPLSIKARALVNRGAAFGQLGNVRDELADYNAVIQMPDAPVDEKAKALVYRGITHGQLGDMQAELADYSTVVDMPNAPVKEKTRALVYRGVTHGQLGDMQAELADYSAVVDTPDTPVDDKAKALVYRGITYGQLGDLQAELADYSTVVEMPDAPVDYKAKALVYRGKIYGELGETQAELADFLAVIDMANAPVDQKATALMECAAIYGQLSDTRKVLATCTAVIELLDAPIDLKACAFFNRGVAFGKLNDWQAAIQDYTTVIEMSNVPIDLKADALLKRGMIFGRSNDTRAELTDYTTVIDMIDVPIEQRARALFSRGLKLGLIGDTKASLADYTAVIEMPDVSIDQKATAFFKRGMLYGQLGDSNAERADYTAVIDIPDAPISQKARALVYRAASYGQMGDIEAALADCNAVINIPDAPISLKARALVGRAAAFCRFGDTDAALADCSAIIELPDAPADLQAIALFCRGTTHLQNRNWEASTNDFLSALNLPEAAPELRTRAMFTLALPMVPICTLKQVSETLADAFQTGAPGSEDYGGNPHDLLSMITDRAPSEWADYVSAIAPLYIKHGVAEKLGQGVTGSIQVLDKKDFSPSQLDLWNQAWQEAGKDCDELQIPLLCLDVAVEILKSDIPTDRPLFRLPLEIRELIRPLLGKTLSLDSINSSSRQGGDGSGK